VQLRFADAQYATGKIVTLAAVTVTIALIIGGIVLERRRPLPAAA
jgi:hypothetical protein